MAATATSIPINEGYFTAQFAHIPLLDDLRLDNHELLLDQTVHSHVEDASQKGDVHDEDSTPENESVSEPGYDGPTNDDDVHCMFQKTLN